MRKILSLLIVGSLLLSFFPSFAGTDAAVNDWDQQARDKISDTYYSFYHKNNSSSNEIESELFVLYRLAQNNYMDLIATDFWRADGRDYRLSHTESSGWLGLESIWLKVNMQPKAKSVAVDGQGQIYWVVAVNGEQVEVESVDMVSFQYKHETKQINQFDGFIHFLDEYEHGINYHRGYIPYKKPIFNGYPDGSLRPFAKISRAEFVQTLATMLELDIPDQTIDVFSDIDHHWARKTINAVSKLNIINGYPDGTFRPDRRITMAEALAVITRVWDYIGYDYLGIDDVNIIENHFDEGVKGIQELAGYRSDWLRQIKTPEESVFCISQDNWAYPYIAATYPIMDSQLFFDDFNCHTIYLPDIDNYEYFGKVDWSRPAKRYHIAALLNVLTDRNFNVIPENERQFTDIKKDYYHCFDGSDEEETDYPEVVMITSTFDYDADGLVNKSRGYGNIVKLRAFKDWEQQHKSKSHQD